MNPDASVLDLVRQLRDDTTQLVRDEVSLAKAEAKEIATRTARNVGFMLAGGAVALAGALVLLLGLAHWLARVLDERGMEPGPAMLVGFGIVALVVIIAGTFLIRKGLAAFQGSSLVPKKTAQSLHEDKEWAKQKLS